MTDPFPMTTLVSPVPVSATLSGLVDAFVVNVKLAVLDPTLIGVKTTPAVQLRPAPRELPQVLVEIE